MDAAKSEQKQLKRREYLLEGNMWKVVLSISLPMVFYNLCNYFYGIYITKMPCFYLLKVSLRRNLKYEKK